MLFLTLYRQCQGTEDTSTERNTLYRLCVKTESAYSGQKLSKTVGFCQRFLAAESSLVIVKA